MKNLTFYYYTSVNKLMLIVAFLFVLQVVFSAKVFEEAGGMEMMEANTHTSGISSEGETLTISKMDSADKSSIACQGRVAVIADGNYRDSDDIIGTPVSLAIVKAFGLEQKLVHYSHSCDLIPGSNDPGGKFREEEMQISCDETAEVWGGFEHLTFYNCMRQKTATISDLSLHINASSEIDPLWIIEAGEPDIIWEAVNNSEKGKRKFIHIVTHHWANDKGDLYDLSDVMALGVPEGNLHRIPDQNKRLKTSLEEWHWARDHNDERITWLWERGVRAQTAEMKYQPIEGYFDCSDAGMLYYWATLPNGGDETADVDKLKTLFLEYVALNP